MYLSPVAFGAVVKGSTVAEGGKRRRLNSPTPPPPSNIFSLPTTPLRSPIPKERNLNRTPAPSTPPNLRLPDLPNPPQFYAMESDLSPDDAAKCTTGVLHLSSKRSMQHYHYWVMDRSIFPKVAERFRFHRVTNSGGFDFISFTPYASEDTYNQLHAHDAPLQPQCFYAKQKTLRQEEPPAVNVKSNGNSVRSGIMISVFCIPLLAPSLTLSLSLPLSPSHSLTLSLSPTGKEERQTKEGFILATHRSCLQRSNPCTSDPFHRCPTNATTTTSCLSRTKCRVSLIGIGFEC